MQFIWLMGVLNFLYYFIPVISMAPTTINISPKGSTSIGSYALARPARSTPDKSLVKHKQLLPLHGRSLLSPPGSFSSALGSSPISAQNATPLTILSLLQKSNIVRAPLASIDEKKKLEEANQEFKLNAATPIKEAQELEENIAAWANPVIAGWITQLQSSQFRTFWFKRISDKYNIQDSNPIKLKQALREELNDDFNTFLKKQFEAQASQEVLAQAIERYKIIPLNTPKSDKERNELVDQLNKQIDVLDWSNQKKPGYCDLCSLFCCILCALCVAKD